MFLRHVKRLVTRQLRNGADGDACRGGAQVHACLMFRGAAGRDW